MSSKIQNPYKFNPIFKMYSSEGEVPKTTKFKPNHDHDTYGRTGQLFKSQTKSESSLSTRSMDSKFRCKRDPFKQSILREEVKGIIGKARLRTKFGLYTFYLVKWKYKSSQEATWHYPNVFENICDKIVAFNILVKGESLPFFSEKHKKSCPNYRDILDKFLTTFIEVKKEESKIKKQKCESFDNFDRISRQTYYEQSQDQHSIKSFQSEYLQRSQMTAVSQSLRQTKKQRLIDKKNRKVQAITQKKNQTTKNIAPDQVSARNSYISSLFQGKIYKIGHSIKDLQKIRELQNFEYSQSKNSEKQLTCLQTQEKISENDKDGSSIKYSSTDQKNEEFELGEIDVRPFLANFVLQKAKAAQKGQIQSLGPIPTDTKSKSKYKNRITKRQLDII